MFLFLMSTSYIHFREAQHKGIFALGICLLCTVHQANCFTGGTIYILCFDVHGKWKIENLKTCATPSMFFFFRTSHPFSCSATQGNICCGFLFLF